MLRVIFITMLLATPALAWEAETGNVCRLSHDEGDVQVVVAYDARTQIYSIAITSARPWRNELVFAMRFDGPRGNQITTNRHTLSADGATLTVTDSGFGNVLDGLEFNQTATAILGDQSVRVGLEDAGPAVRAFRSCAAALGI